MAGKRWTEEELNYLKENYKNKNSCKEISEKLGRSVRAVYTMSDRLNLKIKWDYKRVDKDGYVELILGSSLKVREHRYVYENFHNIKLNSNQHIHHLDEVKNNNSIDNLIVVSPSNHNKLHHLIDIRDLKGLELFKKNILEHDVPKYETWLCSFNNMI